MFLKFPASGMGNQFDKPTCPCPLRYGDKTEPVLSSFITAIIYSMAQTVTYDNEGNSYLVEYGDITSGK